MTSGRRVGDDSRMFALALPLLVAAALPSPLTLDAARAEARAANPGLRAAARQADGAAHRADADGALPPPELMVEVWQPPLSQPWNLYEADMVMVTLSQRFPGWGVRDARREAARADASVEATGADTLGLALDTEVALAFIDYAEAQALYRTHSSHLEVLSRIVEVAQARVTSGGRLDDAAQAARAKARLQADLAVESAGITRAAARLNALLGREPDEALPPLAATTPETVRADARALVAVAWDARPERRQAALAQTAGAARAKAARQEALAPGVSLGLSYFPPVRMAPAHGVGLSLGVELPWLWGGGRAGQAAGEAMHEATREAAADVDYRLRVEVASALATVREATVRVESLERTAWPAAQWAFDTAFASYRSGQGDVLMVLDAQRDIAELHVASVEAHAALERALVALDRALGAKAPRVALEAAPPHAH